VGPVGGGWYGVRDIGDDGCEKIGLGLKIFDDQTRIFRLGDEYRV
jgi:hypothetical protein